MKSEGSNNTEPTVQNGCKAELKHNPMDCGASIYTSNNTEVTVYNRCKPELQ